MQTALKVAMFFLAITGLLATSPVIATPTIWFSDTYETDTLGADPALQTGDNGDGYIVNEPQFGMVDIWNDATAVIDGLPGGVTGSDGQYTSVNRTGSDVATTDNRFVAMLANGGAPNLLATGEHLSIEFDMWKPAGSNGLMLIGYNGTTDIASRMFQVNLYCDGKRVKVLDDNPVSPYYKEYNYYFTTEHPFPLNAWTDVKLDIDPAAQTFSLSFDDDPNVTLTNLPCMLASTITALYVSGFNTSHTGGYNNIYLDNLNIASFLPSSAVPGDTDNDGDVDADDAAIVAQHWGSTMAAGPADGDFTNDGKVDAADASVLAANWTGAGLEGRTAAVPEPTPLVLLLGVSLVLTGRRPR